MAQTNIDRVFVRGGVMESYGEYYAYVDCHNPVHPPVIAAEKPEI